MRVLDRGGPWLLLAALTAISCLASCMGDGDRLEVPTPSVEEYAEMELTSLSATSTKVVNIGGYMTRLDGSVEGVILRSEDGGRRWSRVGSETYRMEGYLIQVLHFNDALRGWAAGVRVVRGETIPVIIRTEDGGGHWREALVPESRASVVSHLAELTFESDEVGTVNVVFVEESSLDLLANVYETRDGGRNWIIKDFKREADEDLTDPAQLFVSAKEGFRLDRPQPNGSQILFFTGTGGETWVPVSQFHLSQLPSYY